MALDLLNYKVSNITQNPATTSLNVLLFIKATKTKIIKSFRK